jgi:hypothetical protein
VSEYVGPADPEFDSMPEFDELEDLLLELRLQGWIAPPGCDE